MPGQWPRLASATGCAPAPCHANWRVLPIATRWSIRCSSNKAAATARSGRSDLGEPRVPESYTYTILKRVSRYRKDQSTGIHATTRRRYKLFLLYHVCMYYEYLLLSVDALSIRLILDRRARPRFLYDTAMCSVR